MEKIKMFFFVKKIAIVLGGRVVIVIKYMMSKFLTYTIREAFKKQKRV